ncbi:MAG: hypothetical protein HOW73_29130 [Polyangiaceae bacterium]|nr:hypothetical protein [Polyangiaceae bacterium]
MTRPDLVDDSPAAPRAQSHACDHVVHFYADEDALSALVAEFLFDGLREASPALAVATAAHRLAIVEQLRLKGCNVELETRSGRLHLLDADGLLSELMVGDRPDPDLFRERVGRTVERLARPGTGRVRVFGEMVDILWRRGNGAAALVLEELWNQLGRSHDFSLLCAYCMNGFYGPGLADEVAAVCARHSGLLVQGDGHDSGGGGRGLVAQIRALEREVQERKQLEVALRDALEQRRRAEVELRKVLDEKDAFFAKLSDQLRASLQAILGWSAILKWDSSLDSASVAKGLDVIAWNAKKQALMLIHAFDLTSLAAGKVTLDSRPTDLAVIVAEAVEMAHAASLSKDIQIRLEPAQGACMTEGDAGRLFQLVYALLDNAIKFTEEKGAVQVRLVCENEFVRVSISDTGRGLEPAHLASLLSNQALPDGARNGLQTGLAIVRYLVALHGGILEAHSAGLGKGATFSVMLPLISSQAFVAEAARP